MKHLYKKIFTTHKQLISFVDINSRLLHLAKLGLEQFLIAPARSKSP